jgi:hypothetical protein
MQAGQCYSLRCALNGCHPRPSIPAVTAQISHRGQDSKLGLCPTLFCVRGNENVTSFKLSVPKYKRKVNENEGRLVLAQNTECDLVLLEDHKHSTHTTISAELGAACYATV